MQQVSESDIKAAYDFLGMFGRACGRVYLAAREEVRFDTAGHPDQAHDAGIVAVQAYAAWVRASDPKEVAVSMIRMARSAEASDGHTTGR